MSKLDKWADTSERLEFKKEEVVNRLEELVKVNASLDKMEMARILKAASILIRYPDTPVVYITRYVSQKAKDLNILMHLTCEGS